MSPRRERETCPSNNIYSKTVTMCESMKIEFSLSYLYIVKSIVITYCVTSFHVSFVALLLITRFLSLLIADYSFAVVRCEVGRERYFIR